MTDLQQANEMLSRHRTDLLRTMGIQGGESEREFDELVELAALICGKPLGAMTLLNDTRLFTKATVGMPSTNLPVSQSVCQYTVQGTGILMVEDLTQDRRFDTVDPVHRENGIRFYAGMPLTSEDGTQMGALCVMDVVPATLEPAQVRALEVLGHQISARLQLRERAATMERINIERDRAQRMLETVLRHSPVATYLKDSEGRFVFYNGQLAQRFGISESEWLGKSDYDLFPSNYADSTTRELKNVLRMGKAAESYLEVPEPNGSTSYWKNMIVPCTDADGQIRIAGVAIDLTAELKREGEMQRIQDELEEANRKLRSLALTDGLTGLWNRRAFDTNLECSVMGSMRSEQPMAMLLLDVDNFKSLNDSFGHPYGDEVLRDLATLFNRVKRGEDLIARFGGEEFAMLLQNTDERGARAFAERVLLAVRQHSWSRREVTVSIGIAAFHRRITSDELISNADSALYQAKHAGKDCAFVYAKPEFLFASPVETSTPANIPQFARRQAISMGESTGFPHAIAGSKISLVSTR